MVKIITMEDSSRIGGHLLKIENECEAYVLLGDLSYFINRSSLPIQKTNSMYPDRYVVNYIFKSIETILKNKTLFNEKESRNLISNLHNIKGLANKPDSELKQSLYYYIKDLTLNLKLKLGHNVINHLEKEDVDKLLVLYHCSNESVKNNINIHKSDYIDLINLSLYLKYTLPVVSFFPTISNLELYTEVYIEIIQKYFNDIYSKIISLIKNRITINFPIEQHNDIYKYYSTIIEADIFMSLIIYYNIFDINEDNNLLNLIYTRIDTLLLTIKHKYITNFIE